MMASEWWKQGWGITPAPAGKGRWLVCFGDQDMAVTTGWYRTRRRAKKEVTHYLLRGAPRGPRHGIYQHFDKKLRRFWFEPAPRAAPAITARQYILVDRVPVPEPDLMKWARWYEDGEQRRVANTELTDDQGNQIGVSTVFLAVDHQWRDGDPLLFETMVFGGPHNRDMFRCSTWEQAEAQHEQVVAFLSQKALGVAE